MKPNKRIRLASPADRAFVDALQLRWASAVGFLSREALANRIEAGEVWIGEFNGQESSYLVTPRQLSNQPEVRPIFQAAVSWELQRRKIGLSLIDHVARQAIADGKLMLQCYCREDLEANEFWRAAGFRPIGRRFSQARRGFPCILWRKPLIQVPPSVLTTVYDAPQRPSATTAILSAAESRSIGHAA